MLAQAPRSCPNLAPATQSLCTYAPFAQLSTSEGALLWSVAGLDSQPVNPACIVQHAFTERLVTATHSSLCYFKCISSFQHGLIADATSADQSLWLTCPAMTHMPCSNLTCQCHEGCTAGHRRPASSAGCRYPVAALLHPGTALGLRPQAQRQHPVETQFQPAVRLPGKPPLPPFLLQGRKMNHLLHWELPLLLKQMMGATSLTAVGVDALINRENCGMLLLQSSLLLLPILLC